MFRDCDSSWTPSVLFFKLIMQLSDLDSFCISKRSLFQNVLFICWDKYKEELLQRNRL